MNKESIIRIGAQNSRLAQWQAELLKTQIEKLGLKAELIFIKSLEGIDQKAALSELSKSGAFTNALDKALSEKQIDLAIHSLKDYPTNTESNISICSFHNRANPYDVLVKNTIEKKVTEDVFVIGTGSIRRKAQWKYKYPSTVFKPLSGTVAARLEKLWDSEWDGIIMAYAGLERLSLISEECVTLNWMIPAPAQGTLGISYLNSSSFAKSLTEKLRNDEVEHCSRIERRFLNKLEGGCSAPIGAIAKITKNLVSFKACLHNLDGLEAVYIAKEVSSAVALEEVNRWVDEILKNGGDSIMSKIKKQNNQ